MGGVYQYEARCFFGPQVIAAVRALYINKLFLATSGLLLPDGLSSSNLPDAEIKQALINSARQVILCMDSSKIGRISLSRFAALDAIDTLVTDSGLSDDDREIIKQHQVQVITVPVLPLEPYSLSLVKGAEKQASRQWSVCMNTRRWDSFAQTRCVTTETQKGLLADES